MVEGGKQLVGEGRRSLERVGGNLAEYLTEESPLLVPRSALAELSQDVIALRDALGRLDKRVSRLEGRR
jgi:ubiquinone biosynthesis protein UbiJ